MRRCERYRSRLVWKTDGLFDVLTNFNETSVWEHRHLKSGSLGTRCDFFTAVTMKRIHFWNVTPCNMVDMYQYSGEVNSFEAVFLAAVNKFHVF